MASAQTACPSGVAPGSPRCGPSPGGAEAPARPTGEWIKTWGAIATASSGDIGSSTGRFSEKDAEAGALKRCADLGNSDCKVAFTYKNQCVAVVQGPDGSGVGKIVSAVSVEAATKEALRRCKEASGSECVVRGTDCSEAQFKKY
ncbi:DUF4189 domain-containing protein [Xanthomonas sacchari]|uniref:DUF4189 domain-containing protein n=1 Tax=Xanthomonas sacchari TaxID=56458 RepID=UPI0020C272D1|nr:DUF4189 domain-containing protein [Xanthomonas sacchari]